MTEKKKEKVEQAALVGTWPKRIVSSPTHGRRHLFCPKRARRFGEYPILIAMHQKQGIMVYFCIQYHRSGAWDRTMRKKRNISQVPVWDPGENQRETLRLALTSAKFNGLCAWEPGRTMTTPCESGLYWLCKFQSSWLARKKTVVVLNIRRRSYMAQPIG